MDHANKPGESQVPERCSLPLTGAGVGTTSGPRPARPSPSPRRWRRPRDDDLLTKRADAASPVAIDSVPAFDQPVNEAPLPTEEAPEPERQELLTQLAATFLSRQKQLPCWESAATSRYVRTAEQGGRDLSQRPVSREQPAPRAGAGLRNP